MQSKIRITEFWVGIGVNQMDTNLKTMTIKAQSWHFLLNFNHQSFNHQSFNHQFLMKSCHWITIIDLKIIDCKIIDLKTWRIAFKLRYLSLYLRSYLSSKWYLLDCQQLIPVGVASDRLQEKLFLRTIQMISLTGRRFSRTVPVEVTRASTLINLRPSRMMFT